VARVVGKVERERVVVEGAPEVRQGPTGLDDIYLQGPEGGAVPLRTVTRMTETTAPLSIGHQGQFPVVTLSFNLAPGVSLGEAVAAVNEATAALGMPLSVHGRFPA